MQGQFVRLQHCKQVCLSRCPKLATWQNVASSNDGKSMPKFRKPPVRFGSFRFLETGMMGGSVRKYKRFVSVFVRIGSVRFLLFNIQPKAAFKAKGLADHSTVSGVSIN